MFVKEILGSKMCLIKEDVGLSLQLMQHGIREEASTKMIQSILKPDWICIDIGANLGYYALLEAKLGGFVYAIEPVKSSYDALVKSIELNNYKNIKVFNLAIDSQTGIKNIKISHRHNWATMLDFKFAAARYKKKFNRFYKGIEKVNAITLDDFVFDNKIDKIDFIRMDVEGYETEIIKGGLKTLKAMPKGTHLTIEIHASLFKDRKPIITMLDTIKHIGFKIICRTWRDKKPEATEATWELLSHQGIGGQTFFMKG